MKNAPTPDRIIVNDYKKLALVLDVNDRVTEVLEQNNNAIAAMLEAINKYTDYMEQQLKDIQDKSESL